MHKNRLIIVLGILIFFIPQSGFTPTTKVFLIELLSAIIVVLAIMIERKGFFSILWHKKSTTTPVAHTYVDHNGTSSINPVVNPEKP
jgi:hypothetical protein